jgi:MFS family permease
MVGPVEELPEINIPDTYFAHERGAYVSMYSWGLNGSNFIASSCAVFNTDGAGWRWVQHWCAIFFAFSFIFAPASREHVHRRWNYRFVTGATFLPMIQKETMLRAKSADRYW